MAAELAAWTSTSGNSSRTVAAHGAKRLQLGVHEGGVVVGRREVGHGAREAQPRLGRDLVDDAERLLGVAGAQAAHARVELDVDADALGARQRRELLDEALAPRHDIGTAATATSSSSADSAPMTSTGPSRPAARRPAASPAVATASQLAPPASAARAAGTAP